MAKDQRTSEPDAASLTLAERLFAMHWRPTSGFSPEKTATECIEAAAAFERVAKNHKPSPTAIPFAGAKAS
jgi:hypothetical protein